MFKVSILAHPIKATTTTASYDGIAGSVHSLPCLSVCALLGVLRCQVWLFRSTRIVFIESFCRVRSLSLCGRMVYGLVDRFIVQWPRLTKQYRLSEYCGRLLLLTRCGGL